MSCTCVWPALLAKCKHVGDSLSLGFSYVVCHVYSGPKISNLLWFHIVFLVCLKQVLLHLRYKAQQKCLTHVINAKLKLPRVGCERIFHFRCSPIEGARPSPSVRSFFFFSNILIRVNYMVSLKVISMVIIIALFYLQAAAYGVIQYSCLHNILWVLMMIIFLITGCTLQNCKPFFFFFFNCF